MGIEYPLVSILIPVYNQKIDYLQKCLDSCLGQTYKNFEIIVVDDGSEEQCRLWLDMWYASVTSYGVSVKLIHQDNKGVSLARNIAIDSSKGDYIVFVDSDDYLEKHFIEKAYKVIYKYNADLVVFTFNYVDGNGVVSSVQYKGNNRKLLLGTNEIAKFQAACLLPQRYPSIGFSYDMCLWGKMFTARFFKGDLGIRLDPYLKSGEDQEVIQQVLTRAKSIVICNDSIYYYRIVEGSISHAYRPYLYDNHMHLCEKIHNILDLHNDILNHAFHMYVIGVFFELSVSYLWHNDCAMSWQEKSLFLKKVRENPLIKKSFKYLKKNDFSFLQIIYLKLIQYKLYDLALIIGWIRKKKVV